MFHESEEQERGQHARVGGQQQRGDAQAGQESRTQIPADAADSSTTNWNRFMRGIVYSTPSRPVLIQGQTSPAITRLTLRTTPAKQHVSDEDVDLGLLRAFVARRRRMSALRSYHASKPANQHFDAQEQSTTRNNLRTAWLLRRTRTFVPR